MSDGWHLDESSVAGLVLGALTAEGHMRALGHLIGGCVGCRARVAETLERVRAAPETPDAYDAAIDAAIDAAAVHQAGLGSEVGEAAVGERLWRELRGMPLGRQETVVCNGRQFVTPAVLRAALADYHDGKWQGPGEALAVARVGVLIAQRLAADAGPAAALADLHGEVLVAAAHAHRLAGRAPAAEGMLIDAARQLKAGSGDQLAKANLVMEWGRLWQSQRRYREAARAFQRVEGMYRKVGDPHLAARALVARADSIGDVHPVLGVRLLRRAVRDLDGERDRELEMVAHHLLAWCLNDAGEGREACRELRASDRFYGRFERYAIVGPSRIWLQGRIDRSLLDLEAAGRAFEQASEVFDDLRLHEQLIMVALDRAELAVVQGNVAAAAALVAQAALRVRELGISATTGRQLGRLHGTVVQGRGSRAAFRQAAVVVRRMWDAGPGGGEGS